jgi:hypothetical protein
VRKWIVLYNPQNGTHPKIKLPIDKVCICMYNLIQRFEWDDRKAEKNQLKHGITFRQAQDVFDDPYAISYEDTEHSEYEQRYLHRVCSGIT